MSTIAGQYEDCVVAFLDILGFSQYVEDSVGNPETLQSLIKAMQAVDAIPAGEKKVSTSGRGQRTIDIRRRFFSDSLVFFHRKRPDDIPQLLFLIRYIQDQLWARGYCLRGSIVLGKMFWMQQDDNVTVGPGLIEAYKAESQLAIYPRITISPELKQCIATENIQANPFGRGERLCEYIRDDSYGVKFLDLLNPGITRQEGEALKGVKNGYAVQYYPNRPSRHAAVLHSVRQIIERNGDTTDSKVREKYDWLNTYCNLHAYNDTPE